MVDWKVVLGEVATQTLRILLPVCIALVLKWAGDLWVKIKTTRPDIATILSYAVDIAVRAAEQVYGSGHGESKKEYAVAIVDRYLREHNLKLDVQVIADAIEAQVWEEFNMWRSRKEEENADTDTE